MERLIDIRTGRELPLYDCPENYQKLEGIRNALAKLNEHQYKLWLAADYKNPEDGFRILEDEVDVVSNEESTTN